MKPRLENILKEHFEKMREKNPRFSQRAFAHRLGLSAGEMSELMRGLRRVSSEKREMILARLELKKKI